MSIIDSITSALKKLFDEVIGYLRKGADEVISQTQFLLDIKEEVKKETEAFKKEAENIFREAEEFKHRVKHLKSKVIRADLVFELVHDIISGELKKFCLEEVAKIADIGTTALDKIVDEAKGLGAVKTSAGGSLGGPIGKFVEVISKTIRVWTAIGRIIGVLRGLTPVLKEVQRKLEKIEKIILKQTSKPRYVPVRFRFNSRRAPKISSGLETNPRGTGQELAITKANLRTSQAALQNCRAGR